MLKDFWVPILTAIISLIGVISVAFLNKNKNFDYMTITQDMLKDVFSNFHFSIQDEVNEKKLLEFLNYLDKHEYSGYLIELYRQGAYVIKLKEKPGSQKNEYKVFSRQYNLTNHKLRNSLNLKLPNSYRLINDPVFVCTLLMIFFGSLLSIGIIGLTKSWSDKTIETIINVGYYGLIFFGIAGIISIFIVGLISFVLYTVEFIVEWKQNRKRDA